MNMVKSRGSVRIVTKSGKSSIGSIFKWDDNEGVGGFNHRVLFGFTKSSKLNSTTYQISLFKLRLFLIRLK